jgi:hypothetical protein
VNKLANDQIRAGTPLPFDCYDGQGHLLLTSGVIVESQKQVDFLLERGLFCISVPTQESDRELNTERAASPFQLLDDCYSRLEHLLVSSEQIINAAPSDSPSATQQLTNFLEGKAAGTQRGLPGKTPPFPQHALQLAKDIQSMCQLDADAVLGAIHLGNTGGRYSISHALNRAVLCELLATRRGIPERNRRQLIAAALTCDLSMRQLQDELTFQTEPLRPEQQQAITEHPHESVKLLEALGAIDPSWTNAVAQHHEFPDGNGYPSGLSGTVISPWARILKLADTYTAMISPRAYRKALLSKAVLRQLFLRRGGEFDEDLAVFFMKELGIFPPGLFVKLHSGELAIVIRRSPNPRAPLVKAIIGPRGAPLDQPIPRQTDIREYEIVDVVERPSFLTEIDQHSLWDYNLQSGSFVSG